MAGIRGTSRRTRRHDGRWLAVLALGPLTVLAGIVWAIVQPYRLTLLHPGGQGFWWLTVEPPLLVIAVGIFFHVFVARGLLRELEASEGQGERS